MSKEEIVNQLKEECSNAGIELTKTDVSKIHDVFMKIIKFGLVGNDSESKVRLHEIGTFSTFTRKERTCRNPLTGKSMVVPEKTGVKFKPSSTLLNALNGERESLNKLEHSDCNS